MSSKVFRNLYLQQNPRVKLMDLPQPMFMNTFFFPRASTTYAYLLHILSNLHISHVINVLKLENFKFVNSTLNGIEQLQFMTLINMWISSLRHNKKLVEHGFMFKIISSLSILAYCGIMQLFKVIPQSLIKIVVSIKQQLH